MNNPLQNNAWKEGDILKYIVLFLIFRTHTHVKHVRARAYMTLISFYLSNTPCENDTSCHKRKTGLHIKNSNQEK